MRAMPPVKSFVLTTATPPDEEREHGNSGGRIGAHGHAICRHYAIAHARAPTTRPRRPSTVKWYRPAMDAATMAAARKDAAIPAPGATSQSASVIANAPA